MGGYLFGIKSHSRYNDRMASDPYQSVFIHRQSDNVPLSRNRVLDTAFRLVLSVTVNNGPGYIKDQVQI